MEYSQAKNLVNQLFTIIDGSNFDELKQVFTPDCVYERPGYEPLAGLPRLETFYRDERIIAYGKHHVTAVTCGDSHVICYGEFIGESRDGKHLQERFADVYELQNDKIHKRTTYFFRPAI